MTSSRSNETEPNRLADALTLLKEAIERDGSAIIYLHDPATGKPFATVIADDEEATRAERLLESVGWNPWNHGHIEADMNWEFKED